MASTEIKVLNAEGAVLGCQAIPAYQPGKRISVWAANAQRKLDALIAQHPGASTGLIGTIQFAVIGGRSQAKNLLGSLPLSAE